MSWPVAIFASFSVLVISVFLFLLIIYLKEYSRDEKLFKQFGDMKEKELLSGAPIYLVSSPPPKKQKIVQEPEVYHKIDKNKKNIN